MGLSRDELTGADFYDHWTELFLRGFGPVLQAGLVRTGDPPREDPEGSVLALAERAGLRDGDLVLDAGCGVAGPALVIARHHPRVVIEGVTTSARQAEIADRRISESGLGDRVTVRVADYQDLPFPTGRFDRVLFFESTGYATDLRATYGEAARVLRSSGSLYVKDVFRRAGPLTVEEAYHMESFDRLWGCARSKTMAESVEAIIDAGLEISHAAPIPEIGTARLAGSMIGITDGGFAPTELGTAFLRRSLNPPIEFGEISAVERSGD